MSKRKSNFIGFVVLVVVALSGYLIYPNVADDLSHSKYEMEVVPLTKIANWNLQIFGVSKADNALLMNSYANKLSAYDIVFVQEIRDKSNTSFWKLCELMPEYTCVLSSRAGRSSSKEQYGLLYKNVKLVEFYDYNPDSSDRWERPPVRAEFNISGYDLVVYNIHTKPDDAESEIDALNKLVIGEGNVVVIGDLNADCSYYSVDGDDFSDWKWLIDSDTTVGKSDCAYDRAITTRDARAEVTAYGVDTAVTAEQSDHYLIWVQIGE